MITITMNDDFTLEADSNVIPPQYSSNIPFYFEIPEQYADALVIPGYIYYDGCARVESAIDNYNNGNFTIPANAFSREGMLAIAFALTIGEKTVTTTTVEFEVRGSVNTSFSLPQTEVWQTMLQNFIDQYMDKVYSKEIEELILKAKELQANDKMLQELINTAIASCGQYKFENGQLFFKKADGTWGEGIDLNVSVEEFENVVRRVTSLEMNGVAVGDTLPIGSIVYIEGDEKDLPTGYKKVDMHPPKQILINNDFQINQRGKTLYNDFGYTLDMWYFYGVAGNGTTKPKIEVKDQGIKITNTDYAWVSIQQVVTDSLRGKTVTICFKAKDLQSNQLASINYPMNVRMCYADTAGGITSDNSYGIKSITEDGKYSITIDIPKNTTHDKLKLAFMIGGSATIEYIDLFEGDVDYPHTKENHSMALWKCQHRIKNIVRGKYFTLPTIFKYYDGSLMGVVETYLDSPTTVLMDGEYVIFSISNGKSNIPYVQFASATYDVADKYLRLTMNDSLGLVNGDTCFVQTMDERGLVILTCEQL